MLRWDVMSVNGTRRTICVPGYYSPTVHMRLLSPQDYYRYHHFNPAETQFFRGSGEWMSLDIKTTESIDDTATEVIAHIDPQARLPFLHAKPMHFDQVGSKEACCYCNVTSIYDIGNINLTQPQKKLKLDHDRLGHLSMQLIQELYQPEELSIPDFDGPSTSGASCLLAKDAAQLRCQIPLCETRTQAPH